MIPADDAAVIAWVRDQLATLDESPRNRFWRHKALGMTRSQAIGDVDRMNKLDLHIPVAELRIIQDAARSRDVSMSMYAKRALGTILAVCEGVDPAAIPTLTKGGLIGRAE